MLEDPKIQAKTEDTFKRKSRLAAKDVLYHSIFTLNVIFFLNAWILNIKLFLTGESGLSCLKALAKVLMTSRILLVLFIQSLFLYLSLHLQIIGLLMIIDNFLIIFVFSVLHASNKLFQCTKLSIRREYSLKL
jgi:hypothetical protein